MWSKKLQPATLFVVLNMPPVCYEFPNLAMRAILEWTPGRAWRQSEDRELHLKDSKPFERRKIFQAESFFIMTCWSQDSSDMNKLYKYYMYLYYTTKKQLNTNHVNSNIVIYSSSLLITFLKMFNEGEWHFAVATFNECLSFASYLCNMYT